MLDNSGGILYNFYNTRRFHFFGKISGGRHRTCERIFWNYMKNKKIAAVMTAILVLASLFSCGKSQNGTDPSETSGKDVGKTPELSNSVEIKLQGNTVSCSDSSVYVTEDTVTITNHAQSTLLDTLKAKLLLKTT